ncbi:MAG: motility protein A [Lachnospiraceae bacterium]|nr:motility protein A [Lachnospiraceae bacterium]
MDLATLIGLAGAGGLMVFGIVSGEMGFAALGNFWDPSSVLITFGGAFMGVLMMRASIPDFVSCLKTFSLAMKMQTVDEEATIKKIIELSNIARKEGLLALEEAAGSIEDSFMKKGILLIVDGTDPELVRSIMETELMCVEGRHKDKIGFWENLASNGPAWGMIGTLIGLINMLKKLDDLAAVGPNMSVALVTTFYGSVLANWIATPMATKLKAKNDAEIQMKEVMVEGLLSIQAGENPRVIEEKLKSFLAPDKRGSLTDGGGEENG